MGDMFGGGGGGNVDSTTARQALHMHTPAALQMQFGPLGQAISRTRGGKIQTQVRAAKPVQEALRAELGRPLTLDRDAMLRATQAYEANIAPIQSQIKEQLGTQFAGLGPAGRRSSRGQFAQAALAQRLQEQGSRELFNIGEAARRGVFREAGQRFDLAARPFTMLAGQAGQMGGQLAGLRGNLAQQLSNTWQQEAMANAQMAAQQRAQDRAGIGSLIGGGISLAGSLFSDRRLKEDIKPVGKLDNGLTVYSYKYKGDPTTHIGLIAQEVQEVNSDAVKVVPMHQDNNEFGMYLAVNYEEAVK